MPEQQSPEGNPQDGKPESHIKPKAESRKRKAVAKLKVGNLRTEVENNSAVDIPNSELYKLSEIEIPKSEIKMEVHHHPQLEHKPKPWKEYLLEGLMIFLAVTMGFFAENLREQISDTHRENEFYKQMIVSTNMLQLHNYIMTNKKILQVLRGNYSLQND